MKRIVMLFLAALFFMVQPAMKAQNTTTMQTCEYWFDYDFDHRQSVALEGKGLFQQQFDLGVLPRGLHSIGLRFADSEGRWNAPLVKHFVIPSLPEPPVKGIAAYEYWFNHGPRVRVDVAPQRLLTLDKVAIEVKDVVPNSITDSYTFNAAEEMAHCPDEVTFGLQAFDDAGHPSQGIVSESFPFTVAVNPQFTVFTESETVSIAAPKVGEMKGFKAVVAKDDSISFTLTGSGQFDLYDAEGNALQCKTESADGLTTYSFLANTTTVYALLWNAPLAIDSMQVGFCRWQPSSVATQFVDIGFRISSKEGSLDIELPDDGFLRIFTIDGVEVLSHHMRRGQQTLFLPAGIYVVDYIGNRTKVVVR